LTFTLSPAPRTHSLVFSVVKLSPNRRDALCFRALRIRVVRLLHLGGDRDATGAGDYTTESLIPAMRDRSSSMVSVCTAASSPK
jgi:hypothetical protein